LHIVDINAIVAVVLANIITLKTKRERTAVTSIGAVVAVVHIVYKVAKIVKVAKAFAILQMTAILHVIVRTAVDRTKFAAIKHPRPGTKYRQTRTSNNK
jgi:hypothetical protein